MGHNTDNTEAWKHERAKVFASYFFDLSKLSFGGWVISTLVAIFTGSSDISTWVTLGAGIITAAGFAIAGRLTLNK